MNLLNVKLIWFIDRLIHAAVDAKPKKTQENKKKTPTHHHH